jgi:hypothetical protein
MDNVEELPIDVTVNLNRGVTKRTHPKDGVQVCMYKDSPGLYMNIHGDELTDEFAAEAGFDIAALEKERQKQEKLAAAQLKVEKEYSAVEGEVVETAGIFEIVCCNENNDQYDVREKGTKKFRNREHLKKEQAVNFAKSLKGGQDGPKT